MLSFSPLVPPYPATFPNALRGISIDKSTESRVYKNTLVGMGSGIFATSNCNNSMLACNTLDTCFYGFKFVTANIGNQFPIDSIPTGNVWNSNFSGGVNYINENTSATINWYFNPGTPTDPSPSIGSTPHILYFSTDSLSYCSSLHSPEETGGDKREQQLGKIMRNQNTYDTLSDEFKLRDSTYAYKVLKSDTTLLIRGTTDDTLYQKFYDSTRINTIGKFERVISLAKDTISTTTPQAIVINQNIPTRCSMEENQKIVNAIYLNEISYNSDSTHLSRYNYDSTELAQLNNVAYQNPLQGGDAVFMARIMLFIDVIDLEMTKSLIAHHPLIKQNENSTYKLYPNPNNGEMQLIYYLSEKENGYVLICDILGKKVGFYKLTKDATILTIKEPKLENGIYFYQIFINDIKVYSDKIIIIK